MSNKKVRVAIIGVGNCASSLVQGVEFYKDTPDDATVPGLMHVNLGGYHIRDIEFTIGIDINVTKVGKDLSEAIFAEPNNTFKFSDVPHLGVPVVRGMTHDGLGKYLSQVITKAPGPTADIVSPPTRQTEQSKFVLQASTPVEERSRFPEAKGKSPATKASERKEAAAGRPLSLTDGLRPATTSHPEPMLTGTMR